MKEIYVKDLDLGHKRRLIKKLYKVKKSKEYPIGLKFCIQYLYQRNDEWLEIVRIDNYLHQNKPGTHIHLFNKEQVKREELTFKEAEIRAEETAEKIIGFLEGEKNGKD